MVASGPTCPAATISRGNLTKPFGYQVSKWRKRLLNLLMKDKETNNFIAGYVADIERLNGSFHELLLGREPVYVDSDDQFLARRLVGIANAYGFRCGTPLSSGSLNFQIEYPEYQQILRVWIDPWPKGLVVFLDRIETFEGQRPSKAILARPQAGNEHVYTRDEIVPEFVRLLELSLKMRAEYLSNTERAETWV